MRILLICHKPPFPSSDGGTLAMAKIAEGLSNEGHQVHIFSFCTNKHPKPSKVSLKPGITAEYHYIDTRLKLAGAMKNLAQNVSYNISRFDQPDIHSKLSRCLTQHQFDIIQLESLFTCPYIPTIKLHSLAPVVYRSHNIEHQIWEQLALTEEKRPKRWYLNTLSKQLKQFEDHVHEQVDGIAAISEEDLKYHSKFHPKAIHIPVGMEMPKAESVSSPTVFHLGSMNWQPNANGIKWFLDEVWPLVHKKHEEAEFHFGGKGMPESFIAYHGKNGIFLHNNVTNAIEFMSDYNIMIIPLLAGSGIRIKAIEGMGLGKAIISTSKGAEGINHAEDVMMIRNTPEAFAEAIIELLSSPEKSQSLGTLAYEQFNIQFDLSSASQKLVSFYQSLLKK